MTAKTRRSGDHWLLARIARDQYGETLRGSRNFVSGYVFRVGSGPSIERVTRLEAVNGVIQGLFRSRWGHCFGTSAGIIASACGHIKNLAGRGKNGSARAYGFRKNPCDSSKWISQ